MTGNDTRKELVNFINKKAFDPILKANPDKFKGEDRKALEDIQRKTENEKKQFAEEYTSAEEVKKNYLSTLKNCC